MKVEVKFEERISYSCRISGAIWSARSTSAATKTWRRSSRAARADRCFAGGNDWKKNLVAKLKKKRTYSAGLVAADSASGQELYDADGCIDTGRDCF